MDRSSLSVKVLRMIDSEYCGDSDIKEEFVQYGEFVIEVLKKNANMSEQNLTDAVSNEFEQYGAFHIELEEVIELSRKVHSLFKEDSSPKSPS